ncbi:MAG TPA: YceI family protein [Phnomibacter sp.]|nr:YceI family protein [Phnomibacter sp.]
MRAFFLFAFFLLAAITRSQENAEKSSLRFEIKNAGITVKGYFENWEYTLEFDPKDLAGSKLSGKADVVSIKTGISSRDKHLQTRQYFKTDTWPYIAMESRRIVHKGGNRYEGEFDVTIRDVTRQMSVPFTAERKDSGWKLSGSFSLNRLDHGVGEKSMILGNEVKVMIDILQ